MVSGGLFPGDLLTRTSYVLPFFYMLSPPLLLDLTIPIMNSIIFCGVMVCSVVDVDQSFRAHFACCLHLANYLFDLLFDPEDGGSMFLRNVRELLLDYNAYFL
jgi:hypothetical protein